MPTRKVDLYLSLFLLGILALTFGGHGTTVDENLVAQVVESMATRGELNCAQMFQALPGPDGKYYSRYGIGFPLMILPFYYLGDSFQWLKPDSRAYCGSPHMFAMLWASVLITVLTGWSFYRLCLQLGGDARVAALFALGLILASPFWPYSQTLYRLNASGAIVILLLLSLLTYERTHSRLCLWAVAGLTAFGLNVREDLVFAFVAIGIWICLRGAFSERWPRAAALMTGAVFGALIWGLHNYIRFRTFFIENYEDLSFQESLLTSVPQLLWGLRRGLIVYAPLSLMPVFSFFAARRKGAVDLWLLCVGVLWVYLILYGKSSMWHGGVCWGPRHMYFLLPFAMLPGIWLFVDRPRLGWKIFFAAAFLWGVVVNWPGIYAYQGKYQSFLESPSFFPLLMKPVEHPIYVAFDDLDLWWVRMMKLNPFSLWPVLFLGLLGLTAFWGYRLMQELKKPVQPIIETK